MSAKSRRSLNTALAKGISKLEKGSLLRKLSSHVSSLISRPAKSDALRVLKLSRSSKSPVLSMEIS